MPVILDRSTGDIAGKQDKKSDSGKKPAQQPSRVVDKKKQTMLMVLLCVVTITSLGYIGWRLFGGEVVPHDIPMGSQSTAPRTSPQSTASPTTAARASTAPPVRRPIQQSRPAAATPGFAGPLEGEPTGRQQDEMSNRPGIH